MHGPDVYVRSWCLYMYMIQNPCETHFDTRAPDVLEGHQLQIDAVLGPGMWTGQNAQAEHVQAPNHVVLLHVALLCIVAYAVLCLVITGHFTLVYDLCCGHHTHSSQTQIVCAHPFS